MEITWREHLMCEDAATKGFYCNFKHAYFEVE
jgi:hypothetical protein